METEGKAWEDGDRVLPVVDVRQRRDVRVDVVGECLVADAWQAVEHTLECHARDVQRQVDRVQERDCGTERVADYGNLLRTEPGDCGLHSREDVTSGPRLRYLC